MRFTVLERRGELKGDTELVGIQETCGVVEEFGVLRGGQVFCGQSVGETRTRIVTISDMVRSLVSIATKRNAARGSRGGCYTRDGFLPFVSLRLHFAYNDVDFDSAPTTTATTTTTFPLVAANSSNLTDTDTTAQCTTLVRLPCLSSCACIQG